jgi:hypothetical protein
MTETRKPGSHFHNRCFNYAEVSTYRTLHIILAKKKSIPADAEETLSVILTIVLQPFA